MAKRITLIPSALEHGPRPAEREVYVKTPRADASARPATLPTGGSQHG